MRTYSKAALALVTALFLVFMAACAVMELQRKSQDQIQREKKLTQLSMQWEKQRFLKLLSVLWF